MKRKLLSFEEASKLLEPYYSDLSACIEGAFFDYLQIKEFTEKLGGINQFEKRTKGSIIHDRIRARVGETFGFDSVFEVKKWNGVFGLKLNNDLLIRFKKLDDNKRMSSFPSQQYQDFLNQAVIEGFPDSPTFLFAGYIPDKSWTILNGIYLACWDGSSLEWFEEIGKYSVQQLNLFDSEDTNQDSEANIQRARLKKKDNNEEKTGTNS